MKLVLSAVICLTGCSLEHEDATSQSDEEERIELSRSVVEETHMAALDEWSKLHLATTPARPSEFSNAVCSKETSEKYLCRYSLKVGGVPADRAYVFGKSRNGKCKIESFQP